MKATKKEEELRLELRTEIPHLMNALSFICVQR